MKSMILGAGAAMLMGSTAMAGNIGVSIAFFNDAYMATVQKNVEEYAAKLGYDTQVVDAENDINKQLSQVENFVASGVDAIILIVVDNEAAPAMTKAAADAGVPMVYVTRQPANVDELPDNQAFIASNEKDSGTLQTQEVCRLLKEEGKGDGANVLVMMGELSNAATRVRTQDIHDVIATDECSFMNIVESQTANWSRNEALDLMTNWLSAGIEFDAVIANNDEMAIGAIQAMEAVGISMDDVVVAGIDATSDALFAMAAGKLDATVLQNAAEQGKGAVEAALALARGEDVAQKVYVPFELVTPANLSDYTGGS